MPHYYLAPYVGAGTIGPGTARDPFRPRGSEQPGWSAIDIRPDSTRTTGRALLAVPVRDDTIGVYLGDDLTRASVATRNAVQSALGLSLQATRLSDIITEILTMHGRTDRTRWKNVKPGAGGRYAIHLGGQVWGAPALSMRNLPLLAAALGVPGLMKRSFGRRDLMRLMLVSGAAMAADLVLMPRLAHATTITESFDTGDSDTLGPDLTWTEDEVDIDVVSNKAQQTAAGHTTARADSDLATDDHYAQAVITGSASTVFPSLICRKASSSTLTHYIAQFNTGADQAHLYKREAGSFTAIESPIATTIATATNYTAKIQADGSTITVWKDGGKISADNTDSAITGNVRGGIAGFNSGVGTMTWDSFQAADVVAATTVPPRRIILW